MSTYTVQVPSKQVGPFKVGMSLNETLLVCRRISEHMSEYFFDDVFKNSFILLREHKLEFIFDAVTQILIAITGNFSPLVSLDNGGLDLRKALEIFPATKKGNFHENFYTVAWPDVHISFKIDDAKLKQLRDLADHPLTADYSPPAERFWFALVSAPVARGIPVTATPAGLVLPSGRGILIKEHSAQDVLTEIGEPDAIDGHVFRYYRLGIMLEIKDRIENIFLFSNLPTHSDSFGLYERCPWTLEVPGRDLVDFRAPWKAIEATLGPCEAPIVLPGVQMFSAPHFNLQFEVSAGFVAVLHVNSSTSV